MPVAENRDGNREYYFNYPVVYSNDAIDGWQNLTINWLHIFNNEIKFGSSVVYLEKSTDIFELVNYLNRGLNMGGHYWKYWYN